MSGRGEGARPQDEASRGAPVGDDEPSDKPSPLRDEPSHPDLRVQPSGLRCPYCHDALRVAGDVAWVACGGCLARHHATCWAEGRACAACGEIVMLARPGGEVSGPRGSPLAIVAVVVVTFVALGLVGGRLFLERLHESAYRASEEAARRVALREAELAARREAQALAEREAAEQARREVEARAAQPARLAVEAPRALVVGEPVAAELSDDGGHVWQVELHGGVTYRLEASGDEGLVIDLRVRGADPLDAVGFGRAPTRFAAKTLTFTPDRTQTFLVLVRGLWGPLDGGGAPRGYTLVARPVVSAR